MTCPRSLPTDVPPGFVEMAPYGAFHTLVAPLYECLRDGRRVVGMRVEAKHANQGAMPPRTYQSMWRRPTRR